MRETPHKNKILLKIVIAPMIRLVFERGGESVAVTMGVPVGGGAVKDGLGDGVRVAGAGVKVAVGGGVTSRSNF